MDTQDVSASRSKSCPQLYKAGIDNLYFKWRVIVVWLIAATFQSLIFFFLPITCAQFPQNNPGRMLGVWDVSTMAYTCILITVNLRLMMASSSLTKWHHISVGGSIAAWFVFIFIYSGVQISFIQVLFLSETCIFTQNGEDWVWSRLWTF
jgi:phospholipid-transporting ATPase